MSYTPGPWEEILLIPDGQIISEGGYEIRTPDYDVVAYYHRGGPIRKQADAHLIAAAPDLFALVEQVEWFQDLYCPWCGSAKPVGHDPDCPRERVLAKVRGDA